MGEKSPLPSLFFEIVGLLFGKKKIQVDFTPKLTAFYGEGYYNIYDTGGELLKCHRIDKILE